MENGYKRLSRYSDDYRYEIIVLVNEDNEYNDISYLIYDLIKNEYKGNLHEKQVYDFLSEKGLYKIEKKQINKKLPADAKNNDLIRVNIIGEINLKE